MAENRLGGTAFISVDGQTYALRADAKYKCNKSSREWVSGMDGPHGTIEKPVVGSISMVLSDGGALTVEDFDTMRDVTVVLELINGKIVTGRNMSTVGDDGQEVDAMEGKFEVKFQGPDVSEQTAS